MTEQAFAMRSGDPSGRGRGDDAAALLRRYLRAVLGDQAAGDRLAQVLRPAGADLPGADDVPAVLCDAMRRWRRACYTAPRALPFTNVALAQALSPGRTPVRQAGILCDVFELSVEQAACALDRSAGEVTRLLAAARTEAARPLGQHVLVVEDDPFVASDLVRIAEEAGAASVRQAESYQGALAAARAARPDLVLCDYDLGAGGNGADLVRTLSREHDATCVFVTAHPERALRGTDGEPAFIIAKPFGERLIRAALSYAASAYRPAVLAA